MDEDMAMRVKDITMLLDENVPIYEGDPRFSVEPRRSIQDDGYALSKLRMGSHTGTHVDAPCHFIEGGKMVAELPLKIFVGRCLVVEDVEDVPEGMHRVLLSSKKGAGRLTAAQAEKLLKKRVRLIGTEHLSIGDDQVHRLLLGNDCVILEALDLSGVEPGEYLLSAAPLKIEADGSPLRACLIEL